MKPAYGEARETLLEGYGGQAGNRPPPGAAHAACTIPVGSTPVGSIHVGPIHVARIYVARPHVARVHVNAACGHTVPAGAADPRASTGSGCHVRRRAGRARARAGPSGRAAQTGVRPAT